jgi:hypothetical protein
VSVIEFPIWSKPPTKAAAKPDGATATARVDFAVHETNLWAGHVPGIRKTPQQYGGPTPIRRPFAELLPSGSSGTTSDRAFRRKAQQSDRRLNLMDDCEDEFVQPVAE